MYIQGLLREALARQEELAQKIDGFKAELRDIGMYAYVCVCVIYTRYTMLFLICIYICIHVLYRYECQADP